MKKLVIVLILLFSVSAISSDTLIDVKGIEFRGIKNVDKTEIIKKSNARTSKGGILIDIQSLKSVMDSDVKIKDYNLIVDKKILIISVEEVYPLFMIFRVDKEISVPCLVDENRNVLYSGRFFKTDMPIIIIEKNFLEDASSSEFINILFSNLIHIAKTSRGFAEELAEIKINRDMDLIVTLKNRKTYFIIKNSLSGFKKIEKSAAYLDSVNTYPEVINLNDRRALIR
ncbi:MAG: hypothetical protein FWH53_02620 [Leptospirales bacterium]|nr:hypothetical protein [Leptospirales bacterium]